MQKPKLVGQIVRAVSRATSKPVTVKIRKGWNDDNVNAVEIASIAEENGAAAIAVHGRTREQFYSGKADWDIIRQVKAAVSVPVIGNGDIWEPDDAGRMIAETGCDVVMLARGTLGNPWLISRTVAYLATGRLPPPPSPQEKISMALRHLKLLVTDKGEERGVKEMRKFAAWYVKGLAGAAAVRGRVTKASSLEEMESILLAFQARFEGVDNKS